MAKTKYICEAGIGVYGEHALKTVRYMINKVDARNIVKAFYGAGNEIRIGVVEDYDAHSRVADIVSTMGPDDLRKWIGSLAVTFQTCWSTHSWPYNESAEPSVSELRIVAAACYGRPVDTEKIKRDFKDSHAYDLFLEYTTKADPVENECIDLLRKEFDKELESYRKAMEEDEKKFEAANNEIKSRYNDEMNKFKSESNERYAKLKTGFVGKIMNLAKEMDGKDYAASKLITDMLEAQGFKFNYDGSLQKDQLVRSW